MTMPCKLMALFTTANAQIEEPSRDIYATQLREKMIREAEVSSVLSSTAVTRSAKLDRLMAGLQI